jgi:hypothetical protein
LAGDLVVDDHGGRRVVLSSMVELYGWCQWQENGCGEVLHKLVMKVAAAREFAPHFSRLTQRTKSEKELESKLESS